MSKKRIDALLLLIIMAVITLTFTLTAHASGILALEGSTEQASAGDIVEVTVSLKNNPGFVGMNLYYTYDKDALTLLSVKNKATELTFTNDKTSVWDGLTNYMKEGALVVLTFQVNDNAASGKYEVKIHFIEAFNEDLDNVYANTVSGYVEVKCAHKNTEIVAEVSPTCVSEGYTAGVRCKDCALFVSGHEVIEKLNTHAWGDWNNISETHHNHECDVCGKGEQAPHAWDQGTIITPATHKNEGVKKYTCNGCGVEKSESVPRIEHVFDQRQATDQFLKTAATCSAPAEYYWSCSCGEKGTETFTYGTTLSHAWNTAWESNRDGHYHICDVCHAVSAVSSHTSSGSATEDRAETCTTCGYVITPAIEHVHRIVAIAANEPTCTKDGNIEYYFCSSCEKYYEDIAATREISDQQNTIVNATGHQEVKDVGVAPTCTSEGRTDGSHCSVCSAILTQQETIMAKGHTPGEWIVDQEPAPGVEGSQHKVCTVCNETLETGVIEALPEETDSEVETDEGKGTGVETPEQSDSQQNESAPSGGCSGLVNMSVFCLIIVLMVFLMKRREECF